VSAILTCLEWYLDTQLEATALSPDRHGPPGRNHLQRGRFSLTPQASSVAPAAGLPHEKTAHASSNFVLAQIFSLSCFFSTPRGGRIRCPEPWHAENTVKKQKEKREESHVCIGLWRITLPAGRGN